MAKKQKQSAVVVGKQPLLQPIDIDKIGSNQDPCFGTAYDLSTSECKLCGDSELCCIKMAQHLGKTRKELEQEQTFKDIESKIDKPGVKKYYRGLKRKGHTKKEIIASMQSKYELTLQEARSLYREFTNN